MFYGIRMRILFHGLSNQMRKKNFFFVNHAETCVHGPVAGNTHLKKVLWTIYKRGKIMIKKTYIFRTGESNPGLRGAPAFPKNMKARYASRYTSAD